MSKRDKENIDIFTPDGLKEDATPGMVAEEFDSPPGYYY